MPIPPALANLAGRSLNFVYHASPFFGINGLFTYHKVQIGPDVGAGTKLHVVDTSTSGDPSVFMFSHDSRNTGNNFHQPFVFQHNYYGDGHRNSFNVVANWYGTGGSAGTFLCGAQIRNEAHSGSGFSIALATASHVAAGVATVSSEAIECSTENHGPTIRSVGVHVVDGSSVLSNGISTGVLINSAGVGWNSAIHFGLDNLPVRSGQVLMDTMSSSVSLRAIADFSKLQPGTDGSILLAYGGSIKFGSPGAVGDGGRIECVGGSAGRLAFGEHATFIDFANGQQHRFEASRYTAPALSLTSLVNAANDSAAALAGVPVNGVYRNGSTLMIRVS